MNDSKNAVTHPANPKPTAEQQERAAQITDLYAAFGIYIGPCIGVWAGPRVTRFEFQLDPDTQVAKILQLADDVSLNLSVPRVRLICPIRGRMAFGIEVPNRTERFVDFEEVLASKAFTQSGDKLRVALGESLSGDGACLELSTAPHVLIGGQSGSGKTTMVNTMVASLLSTTTPDEVRLLLMAPQKQELEIYESAPHVMEPVVCDAGMAIRRLQELCRECDRRYGLFHDRAVRCLDAYNRVVEQPLCRMVILVDEMSFLTKHDRWGFESAVCQLAQKGRMAGIHLVLTTSDLTANTVTGMIKANIPTRIALSTKNRMDSRTIMDAVGAECLLQKGDMLLCDCGMNPPQRIQAARLTPAQIQDILHQIRGEII